MYAKRWRWWRTCTARWSAHHLLINITTTHTRTYMPPQHSNSIAIAKCTSSSGSCGCFCRSRRVEAYVAFLFSLHFLFTLTFFVLSVLLFLSHNLFMPCNYIVVHARSLSLCVFVLINISSFFALFPFCLMTMMMMMLVDKRIQVMSVIVISFLWTINEKQLEK